MLRFTKVPAGHWAIRRRRSGPPELLSRVGVYVYCPWFTTVEAVDSRLRHTALVSLRSTTSDGITVALTATVSWRLSDPLKATSQIRDMDAMVSHELREAVTSLLEGVSSDLLRSRGALNGTLLVEFRQRMQTSGVSVGDCRISGLQRGS